MMSLQEGVLLENKDRFENGWQMHSNIKCLRGEGMGDDSQTKW